jgi:hypothetical protein
VHEGAQRRKLEKEFQMKRMILALAGVALIASANVASAKTPRHGHGGWVQRNVGLSAQPVYHANGDFKYGPQIDYPQSPPGGGY